MLADVVVGIGHTVVMADFADTANAGSDLFDRVHAVKHAEQERIAGDALDAEQLGGHSGGKSAGADDFEAILEDIDLYIGVGAVVAVSQCIDDGFAQGGFGEFGSLFACHGFDDEFGVELAEQPSDGVLIVAVDISIKILAIENARFGVAKKQSTGDMGGRAGLADVVG
ncbi:MAG: hypothetical protein DRP64_08810 [Verrucomicrobia bacterium]|nr:MAG: hypothetical protein DRP64_08810 [Verrucomicrobiota bacterium]